MKILKFLFYIILILGLGTGVYYSYLLYNDAKDEPIDALYLIPENAAIVFYSPDYHALKDELLSKSELWPLFEKDVNLQRFLQNFDSLYTSLIKEINGNPIKSYYSIHFAGNNKFQSEISFYFDKAIDSKQINDQLLLLGKVESRDFEGKIIYSIVQKESRKRLNFVYQHGTLSVSENMQLIEKTILEAKARKKSKLANVSRMLKIVGKDSKASVFINYRYIYRLIGSFASKDYISSLKQISSLSSYSVLDLNGDNLSMSLNGFSFSADSVKSRLSQYQYYEAPEIDIFNHIPAQTAFVYYEGAAKLNEFLEQRSKSEFAVEDERSMKQYKADLMTDVRQYFYPWIKSELAFCILKEKANKNSAESFAIMNTYDPKESLQSLNKLMKIACDFKDVIIDTIEYRTYKINNIPLPYLLSNLFGDVFNPIKNTFFTIVDNYVVFASKATTLEKYIDNILIKKTMASREGFSDFYNKISPEANVMIYANMHAFDKIFNKFVSSDTRAYLQNSSMSLNDFGDASIQFIASENGVYTAVNLNKTEIPEDEDAISWQIALDNKFVKGPFVVLNHRTNKKDIIVFDNHNMMYRINHLGEILWAIPVAELPLGDVQSVDYYRNGKYQILYNSAKYMYMYDLNGNRVEDYPIQIIPEATAPLNAVDYDKNAKYRIIIPLSDGVIHNYKIDGSQTKGWKNPSMENVVVSPVQYFKLGSKDFLLITDTLGNVVFSNRRGEARIEAKLAFTNNSNTSFYKLGSKLVTTDRLGRLIIIDDKGLVEKYLIRDFSKEHYFVLLDVDMDGRKEYVFYDDNELFIYNQKRELLWQKKLTNPISPRLVSLYKMLDDSSSFMMYEQDNQQFLFGNSRGYLGVKDEYSASKSFMVYKTTKTDNIRLVSAKGRIVSNYLLK